MDSKLKSKYDVTNKLTKFKLFKIDDSINTTDFLLNNLENTGKPLKIKTKRASTATETQRIKNQ